jgi:hypothetical protein
MSSIDETSKATAQRAEPVLAQAPEAVPSTLLSFTLPVFIRSS